MRYSDFDKEQALKKVLWILKDKGIVIKEFASRIGVTPGTLIAALNLHDPTVPNKKTRVLIEDYLKIHYKG